MLLASELNRESSLLKTLEEHKILFNFLCFYIPVLKKRIFKGYFFYRLWLHSVAIKLQSQKITSKNKKKIPYALTKR
jgi:hypothetical protein